MLSTLISYEFTAYRSLYPPKSYMFPSAILQLEKYEGGNEMLVSQVLKLDDSIWDIMIEFKRLYGLE